MVSFVVSISPSSLPIILLTISPSSLPIILRIIFNLTLCLRITTAPVAERGSFLLLLLLFLIFYLACIFALFCRVLFDVVFFIQICHVVHETRILSSACCLTCKAIFLD